MDKNYNYSQLNRNNNLFFSLVDYRNNYFTANDLHKIMEFHQGFRNRNELIKWMRERPTGSYIIHEFKGNDDIIVVIPTMNIDGEFAKKCRDNIFKDFHIIFVESGEVPDFYFNYAHNCNVGIKKAMEYNPRWIILSNDDINSNFKADDLEAELSKINNKTTNIVLSRNGSQSSSKTSICSFTTLGSLIFKFLNITRLYILLKNYKNLYISMQISQKFGNRYFVLGYGKNIFNIIRKRVYSFYNFEAFGIFSYEWLKHRSGLFDETYINAHEDIDTSILLSKEPEKIAWINYGINGVGGVSLGNNLQRGLRTVASSCYLNYKIEEGLLDKIDNFK